ncbi:tubulinyl-Tyr carboxypeptidase 1-like isoform X2 [Mercenaria mercenaria]|uniref:tubulinyl-Tyr carboxypeptidase 1-like isoform X2 n=1 Tax=Mercenaria mercenaria TaxID=6596 RepID=UPI00234EE92F|nr:tubulinyl-Tyr carboxypeptidase 1-like isoform X2 [Mercenaria mercenaria]
MSRQPLCNFGTLVRISDSEEEDTDKRKLKKKMKRNGTQSSLHDARSRPSTVNEEDQREENGVWFWVNKNGFPVDDMTWGRMWDHVAKIHPDGYKMVSTIRGNSSLPQVPVPQAPMSFSPSLSILERLEKIQNYMNTLQYNHTGTQFFEIKKNRPISGLMEVAKDMIRESLPIKCLEAIILGVFLTNGMMGMERFPISFKTQFNTNIHRHVVLGVYHAGRYGALGMSRRDDLMYKPLIYKTLSELIIDYERAYKKYWHDVKKIKIGLPIPHDPHSYEFIQWKTLTLTCSRLTQQELIKEIDTHATEIRTRGKLCWVYHKEPTLFLHKSRSWSVPQTNSPRKSMSIADLDHPRHSKSNGNHSSQSSFTQAIKLYQGGTTKEVSTGKKKEGADLGEYQIRI